MSARKDAVAGPLGVRLRWTNSWRLHVAYEMILHATNRKRVPKYLGAK
jgi:hypothetical protein